MATIPPVAKLDDFLVRWWEVVAPAIDTDLVLDHLTKYKHPSAGLIKQEYTCAERTDMCKVNKATSALCKSDWHQRTCMGERAIDGLTDTSDPARVKQVLKIIKIIRSFGGGVSTQVKAMKFHPTDDRYVAIVFGTALRVLKLGTDRDAYDAEFLKMDDGLDERLLEMVEDDPVRMEMPQMNILWSPYMIGCVVSTEDTKLFVNWDTKRYETIFTDDMYMYEDYTASLDNRWSSDGKYLLTAADTDALYDGEVLGHWVHLYDIAANTTRCLKSGEYDEYLDIIDTDSLAISERCFSTDNRYCFWSGTYFSPDSGERNDYVNDNPGSITEYVVIYNLNNHMSHVIRYDGVRVEKISDVSIRSHQSVVESAARNGVVVTRASGEVHTYNLDALEFTQHDIDYMKR
jgi:hypothetical protein